MSVKTSAPWQRLSSEELEERVRAALAENASYRDRDEPVLGVPGTVLDRRVFYDAPFLEHAPFLSCMLENPNHIGCHTLGLSEPIFPGTQALEVEVVRVCAEELLGADPGTVDGYVATGGTEANIQALWVFRNRFRERYGVTSEQVVVLHSEDTHYSIHKACDLLGLTPATLPVDPATRALQLGPLREAVAAAQRRGPVCFAVVLNLGTTMFGSVDRLDPVLEVLEAAQARYEVHVDAAFGGFIYPLTHPANPLSLRRPEVSSFTLDAHKMLQAPYGTGVYLVRKGYLASVCTQEASYVRGHDYTLCGSRSGANAVAVWLILHAYGPEGGREFLAQLLARTERLCAGLDARRVAYFREPHMNVVALRAEDVPPAAARRFHLVPDDHHAPRWWKVVVMDHVDDELIERFLAAW